MELEDPLYGKVAVSEPVLLDLIHSRAIQRLQGIAQHGITALLGITPPFTRFDHSIGAMLLVRRLGADLDEQIAALLHDVSHTAFSHVIDFVFGDHSGQSYHEEKKEGFIAASDLPEILRQHGRNWRDFLDEENYSLLEQPSPALCADRLDYFLRDLEFLGLASRVEVQMAVDALVVQDGIMAVDNPDVARWLAYTFIEADRASWSSFREVGLYQLTAEAIKIASGLGVIGEADLWGEDRNLWEKLYSSANSELEPLVKLISPETRFVWDDTNPAFRVTTKVRTIDPGIVLGRKLTRLSEIDLDFAHYREQYLASKQGQWPMSVAAVPDVSMSE